MPTDPLFFFFYGQMVIRMPSCSVRPEFIRYTAAELDEMRAAGDLVALDIAERMNAACDLAEGKVPHAD